MKRIAVFISVLLIVELLLFPAGVEAEMIKFSPDTPNGPSVQGQLPITKVGALLTADALAILNGNEIKIESKSSKTNQQATDLLTGLIINAAVQGTGSSAKLSACAYFTGGEKLEKLDKPNSTDKVKSKSGKVHSGKITSVTNDGCVIETANGVEQIKVGDIDSIESPRAFTFSLPVLSSTLGSNQISTTDIPKLDLHPTSVIEGGATKVTTRSSKVKRILIVATAVTLIATAIAVPVAVGVATHHSHHTTFVPPLTNTPSLPATVPLPPPVTYLPRLPSLPPPTNNGGNGFNGFNGNRYYNPFSNFNANR